jgi:aminoglycoside phosphotransferase (APT) family kinase protein
MATEARTMEYARAHGYPVPAVEEISDDGTDLVMERLSGPSMGTDLTRRPWTMRHQATVLADLHRRLHEIPAPDWLPPAPCGEGDRLVHLDLHPLNVVLTAKGPVVIDWPNAKRGDGPTDVALTWVLMACGGIPLGRVRAAVLGRGRGVLVNAFLRDFDLAAVRRQLADVVEWKVKDPNMTEVERQAMWHLARTRGAA